jgi:ABC-type Fe3+-siderophore transport system permease subunit
MVASLLAALIVLPVLLQRVTERAAPGARPEVAGVSSGAAVRS